MDPEVLRVVIAIAAFLALGVAGMFGVPFAGLAMAAIGVLLGLDALRALDYAGLAHEFRCDESCNPARGGWQFTQDARQWNDLWIAAVAGTVAVWLSVALAAIAGAAPLLPAVRRAARPLYLLTMLAMAITLAAFGAFTVLVAPFGDRYGI
jgi:hypothetical protein